MRELKRSIARSLMKDEGVAHVNRKTMARVRGVRSPTLPSTGGAT